jgi:hypothetical protein
MRDAGKQSLQVFATDWMHILPGGIRPPQQAPGRNFSARHRARNSIALRQLAAKLQKHVSAFHVLHTFGNNLAVEGLCQANNPSNIAKSSASSNMSRTKLRSIFSRTKLVPTSDSCLAI